MTSSTPTTLWVHHAYEDYAASRCLLLHGLFSGFVLAEQSVEKMFKAYLYSLPCFPVGTKFVGPKAQTPSILEVTPAHDLVALATLVEREFQTLNLNLTDTYRGLLEELSYHFHRKYPDNETPLKSSETETLSKIDALMVLLSLKIPVDDKNRWRTGIFYSAWPEILIDQPDPPRSVWVRKQNLAYIEASPEIRDKVKKGHADCYPDQPL